MSGRDSGDGFHPQAAGGGDGGARDGSFHDVVYEALVADPLAEVARLYERLALELSPLARRRMAAWIGRHHRGRASTHRYALADFGLDAGEVERRFARYRAWVASMTPS